MSVPPVTAPSAASRLTARRKSSEARRACTCREIYARSRRVSPARHWMMIRGDWFEGASRSYRREITPLATCSHGRAACARAAPALRRGSLGLDEGSLRPAPGACQLTAASARLAPAPAASGGSRSRRRRRGFLLFHGQLERRLRGLCRLARALRRPFGFPEGFACLLPQGFGKLGFLPGLVGKAARALRDARERPVIGAELRAAPSVPFFHDEVLGGCPQERWTTCE